MNAKPPLITIAIPTYRPDTLATALQSVFDQDFDDFEILISDNCATDAVKQIVASFPQEKITYWPNPPEVTLSPKLQQFLDRARTPWMVVLGDDDRFEPGYLSAMASHIRRYPDASSIHTRYRLVDEKGNWIWNNRPVRETPGRFDYLKTVFLPWQDRLVNIGGVMFSVEKIRSVGGFLPTWHAWNSDTAAWAWLGLTGRVVFENRPLVQICINPGSSYKKRDGDYTVYLDVKKQFFDSMEALYRQAFSSAVRPAEKRSLTRSRAMYLRHWMREEAALRLEPYFLHFLTLDLPESQRQVQALLAAIQERGLPINLSIYSFYQYLSSKPLKTRDLIWKAFFRIRHLYRTFKPPKHWHAMLPAVEKRGLWWRWRLQQVRALLGLKKH